MEVPGGVQNGSANLPIVFFKVQVFDPPPRWGGGGNTPARLQGCQPPNRHVPCIGLSQDQFSIVKEKQKSKFAKEAVS